MMFKTYSRRTKSESNVKKHNYFLEVIWDSGVIQLVDTEDSYYVLEWLKEGKQQLKMTVWGKIKTITVVVK